MGVAVDLLMVVHCFGAIIILMLIFKLTAKSDLSFFLGMVD